MTRNTTEVRNSLLSNLSVAVTGLLLIVMFVIAVGEIINILSSGDMLAILLTVPIGIGCILLGMWILAAYIFKD